jgi:hypothetical protein
VLFRSDAVRLADASALSAAIQAIDPGDTVVLTV